MSMENCFKQYEELLEQILPADKAAFKACLDHFDHIAKPLGSLGELEDLTARIGAVHGAGPDGLVRSIDVGKKCILVFCADNGVVANGVAQSTSDVTTSIANSMARGTASVNVMARAAGAEVFPIDMGMKDTAPVINRKLMNGTRDMTKEPAMTRETAVKAILTGAEFVKEMKEKGFRVVGTGEAGIGNTTTSAAMAAVLLNKDPSFVTGRGAGLSDAGLERKREAVRKAIETNQPDPEDPVDVLSKVGGLDIAGMAGAFIGGAAFHVPVVIDGLISAVAALTACRIAPAVRDYILPSHFSTEPAMALICEELGLRPILHAGMRLGEGTGAAALFPVLDLAAAEYNEAASFDDIHVEQYTRQS